jgi:hypothetical protein
MSSIYAATSSGALTVAKPSIPNFTLELNNSVIEITIKNQQLILTTDNESLYYNVRVKDHFGDQWTELYTINSLDFPNVKGTIPIQSDAQYTILSCPAINYPLNTTVDFQVQAMYGHYYMQTPANQSPFVPDTVAFGVFANGESGWSSTQTMTIFSYSQSPTESPPNFGPTSSTEPNIGELALTLASVAIGLSVFCVIILLFYVRHLRNSLKPH